jgi:uroporphyrinogen-III synthase
MLRARFDRVARGIAQAAIAPKGAGWIDRILRRLSKVVTIRRVGEPVPSATGPTARVARAELRLAADDLAGAVAALGGLVGAPAEAATAWRTDAAARLKADAALATLTARAIAVFGGAPAAGGAAGG